MRTRIFSTLIFLLGAAACGPDAVIEGDMGIEPVDDGVGFAQRGLYSCVERHDTGYRDGTPFDIKVVTVDGKPVEVDTANAYIVMQQAAARDGVFIHIVSGFRTMAEQQYFWGCFVNCNCNNCNEAAPPGHSNHQSGHALDLNTRDAGVYNWLSNHGERFGFRRTVPGEIWHWEWWGGGPGGGPCGKKHDRLPASERSEAALSSPLHDPAANSDVDGDGIADLCARNSQGMVCFLANGSGFSPRIDGPDLSDDKGWDRRSRYSTIRMADIDGDGRGDLCAKGGDGFRCWRSRGDRFGGAITTNFMQDEHGWDDISQYSTIRMADIDGDGKADVCGRKKTGFVCWRSLGDQFGGAIEGPAWSNENGWNERNNYGTIRMGDIDGDGKDDVCGRADKTIRCFRSNGRGFGRRIDGPDWSDDKGWDDVDNWSTINLVDLNGDGRADLCARNNARYECHLSRGDHFGGAIRGPELSNKKGWDDHDNYSTLRLADIDADGDRDLCGRSTGGVRCWKFEAGKFAEQPIGSGLFDDEGPADAPKYYRTIRFADIDGDGRADICGRMPAGIRCWHATGRRFEGRIVGPEWSDEGGWDHEKYNATIQLSSAR